MGRNSLWYLSESMDWASSISNRIWAVLPTTLEWGSALRNIWRALPRTTLCPDSVRQTPP